MTTTGDDSDELSSQPIGVKYIDNLSAKSSSKRKESLASLAELARKGHFTTDDYDDYLDTAVTALLQIVRHYSDEEEGIKALNTLALLSVSCSTKLALSFADILALCDSMLRTSHLNVCAAFVEALITSLVFDLDDPMQYAKPVMTFCGNILSRRMTNESKMIDFNNAVFEDRGDSDHGSEMMDDEFDDEEEDEIPPREEDDKSASSSSEILYKRPKKKPANRGKKKARKPQSKPPSKASTPLPTKDISPVPKTPPHPKMSGAFLTKPSPSLAYYDTSGGVEFDQYRMTPESATSGGIAPTTAFPLPSSSPIYNIPLCGTPVIIRLRRVNENSDRSNLVTHTIHALNFFFSSLGFIVFHESHLFLEFAARYLCDPSKDVRIAAANLIALFESLGERDNDSPDHIPDDHIFNWCQTALTALSKESTHTKSKKDKAEQRKTVQTVLKFLEDGEEPTQNYLIGSTNYTFESWAMITRVEYITSLIGADLSIHVRNNQAVQDCLDIEAPAGRGQGHGSDGRIKVSQSSALGKHRDATRHKDRKKKGEYTHSWMDDER
ncbi:hypothetical protein BLNAU_4491 [Blattamonas nauphoetae]|uniref:Interferon-related developmental regulator N-terminal domain-containing protein n=1 Tax=Blattamonas nauphoetae TaxID=2049346 RepID=A0ABQ9YA70_9EUKA|nr:hypothetical protein BLNAU_4491 [Blattamonas nauphoetae]